MKSQLQNLEHILQSIYEATQLLSTSKYLAISDMYDYWKLALDKTSILLTVFDP
ncbi:2978_t:CDS:2 [Dentiscutata erythropus]|uniref:2978_t:CDS:1 n=1 Tax=Dentiscutata erythropus TaxID=1348616 RepID=A0A9N9AQ57_9GLOM|nr:2978_t:CDS:2 [Dentiscutata erythropus]